MVQPMTQQKKDLPALAGRSTNWAMCNMSAVQILTRVGIGAMA